MKKIIGVIVAVLLVAGLAGYASADLTADSELVRVVYNTTFNGSSGQPTASTGTYDVITDLGNISSILSTVSTSGSDTVGGGVNAFTNNFSENTGFASKDSSLMVAYFVINYTANNAYISGSSATTPLKSAGSLNFDSFAGGLQGSTLSTAQGTLESGTSTAVIAQSAAYSFQSVAESAGPGSFAGFIVNGGNAFLTESKLATLASGSVVQYLYYFSNGYADQTGTLVTDPGIPVEILTNANGSTTIEAPATVPVPPSLLLLAPGLLGLIGIRRRVS